MLAAILHVPLADLLAEPGQRGRQDALAAARAEERELLGQLLQATRSLQQHRAAHAVAARGVADLAAQVEALQARYAEAQARAEALAADTGGALVSAARVALGLVAGERFSRGIFCQRPDQRCGGLGS